MYCPKCGANNLDTARMCTQCGFSLTGTAPEAQSYGPVAGKPSVPNHLVPAILTTAFCCLPFGVVAIVYATQVNGKVAAGNIQGAIADSQKAKVWSIVSACTGIIPMFLIFAAILIPNLLRARMAANEASAVGSIRTINTAQSTYSTAYPDAGFACQLSDLGGPKDTCSHSDGASPQHACLIDDVLTSGTKSGYRFSIVSCKRDSATATEFQTTAEPVSPGQSGQRVFCSDQTGVIRSLKGGSGDDCLTSGEPLR